MIKIYSLPLFSTNFLRPHTSSLAKCERYISIGEVADIWVQKQWLWHHSASAYSLRFRARDYKANITCNHDSLNNKWRTSLECGVHYNQSYFLPKSGSHISTWSLIFLANTEVDILRSVMTSIDCHNKEPLKGYWPHLMTFESDPNHPNAIELCLFSLNSTPLLKVNTDSTDRYSAGRRSVIMMMNESMQLLNAYLFDFPFEDFRSWWSRYASFASNKEATTEFHTISLQ